MKVPALSHHVSDTLTIFTPIRFISFIRFAVLHGTFRLCTFHVSIFLQLPTDGTVVPVCTRQPWQLQPLDDGAAAPALSRPPHRTRPCASFGSKLLLPVRLTFCLLLIVNLRGSSSALGPQNQCSCFPILIASYDLHRCRGQILVYPTAHRGRLFHTGY